MRKERKDEGSSERRSERKQTSKAARKTRERKQDELKRPGTRRRGYLPFKLDEVWGERLETGVQCPSHPNIPRSPRPRVYVPDKRSYRPCRPTVGPFCFTCSAFSTILSVAPCSASLRPGTTVMIYLCIVVHSHWDSALSAQLQPHYCDSVTSEIDTSCYGHALYPGDAGAPLFRRSDSPRLPRPPVLKVLKLSLAFTTRLSISLGYLAMFH